MIPTKILYVIGSMNLGGAESHLVQILSRMDRSRWEPIVYCLTEAGMLAPKLKDLNITVVVSAVPQPKEEQWRTMRFVRIIMKAVRLAKFMRQLRPSIAHFFLPAAYIMGAPAAIVARAPIRVMSRRSLNVYQSRKWLSRTLERNLHRFMHAVLGNSRRVVCELELQEGVPRSRLGLIYNDIDSRVFGSMSERQSARESLELKSSTFVMTIVANLIPYKGHRDLIEALALASTRLPNDWRLLVVGRDDGIGVDLRSQAAKAGIAQNINFLGLRKDISALLAASDVGLLCSHEEGFSNSVLEGMASGLPMIVTDVGGNPEAVIDGECGIVVPSRSPSHLADAILCLSGDAGLRQRYGANARRRIVEKFDFNRAIDAYDELYRALLAGNSPQNVALCRITD